MSPGHARLIERDIKPLIGVIHLPPLAGPQATSPQTILERTQTDAEAYAEAGFDAVLVENFGDTPFPKQGSDPHVPALIARAIVAAKDAAKHLPVGCNILRNDALAAIGACHAAGGSFVRVNVYTGTMLTDQGIIEGDAHTIERYRERLGASRRNKRPAAPANILIAADMRVKHAQPLMDRPIEDDAADSVERAHADILIVSGGATGRAIDITEVDRCRRGAPDTPIWIGSGLDTRNMAPLLGQADGAIIGTAAKQDGLLSSAVDPERAAALVQAADKVRG